MQKVSYDAGAKNGGRSRSCSDCVFGVKNNLSINGPATMNKNTKETMFSISVKFSLAGENYVARWQTEYRTKVILSDDAS